MDSPAPAQSDLPEQEELTPEIMEDECLRGDAMLRWAALLLAVLLSWTYITDTAVLVHIRSGEAMLTNGILPPRVDSLSASAAGRAWVNLGWLSDLTLGLANKAGNWAVTLVGVICVFFGFRTLNHVVLPKVTTWWGSVCMVMAAIAIFPVLQPGMGAVTVLGMSCLLWLLNEWKYRSVQGMLWKTGLLMCLWSNADANAFLGAIVLLCWGIGEQIQPTMAHGDSGSRINPWKIVGTGVLGIIVHPWHINALLAPYVKLAYIAPEMQLYAESSDMGFNWLPYGLIQPEFWKAADASAYTGVALLVLALTGLVLNSKRLNWGLALMWLSVNLLGCFSGELFALASVVNAVVATMTGQDWYRHNGSMEFKIDWWSVAKVQAGRVLTVLGIFGLAYLIINGSIMGPAGRRIGMGLDPRWRDRIQGIESLTTSMLGDRVFPLRVDQGDLLIWVGKKPFVDSRFGLYAPGAENLLATHRSIRVALRRENPKVLGSGKSDVWQESLQKYETYNVMPRLWGQPDYSSFFDLAQTGWRLSGMSGSAAVFLPQDFGGPDVESFIKNHSATDFVKDGLREPDPATIVSLTPTWPAPPNVYDKWFIQKIPQINDGTQMAIHFNNLRFESMQMLDFALTRASDPQEKNVAEYAKFATESFPRALALSFLAIRNARRGIDENSQAGYQAGAQVPAYRVLRETYLELGRLEQVLGERFGGVQVPANMRTSQSLSAAYDALRASNDPADMYALAQIQMQVGAVDLSLKSYDQFQMETGKLTLLPLDTDAGLEQSDETEALVEQLRTHVLSVRDAIDAQRQEDATPQQLLGIAMQGNCPGIALEIIEENRTIISENIPLTLFYAEQLLTNGRPEEAWETLESMARRFPDERISPQDIQLFQQWCYLTTVANLSGLDLERAEEILMQQSAGQLHSHVRGLIELSPLQYSAAPQADLSPSLMTALAFDMYSRRNVEWDMTRFDLARIRWDLGDVKGAQAALEEVIEEHPQSPLRPVIAWMLTVITQKPVDAGVPSDQTPAVPAADQPPASQEAAAPQQ